jgi:hypothetical protein
MKDVKLYVKSAVWYGGIAESFTGEFREIMEDVKFPANYIEFG